MSLMQRPCCDKVLRKVQKTSTLNSDPLLSVKEYTLEAVGPFTSFITLLSQQKHKIITAFGHFEGICEYADRES